MVRKMWYVYTMEYYSAIQRNKIKSVEVMWMKLEPVIENKVSTERENPI